MSSSSYPKPSQALPCRLRGESEKHTGKTGMNSQWVFPVQGAIPGHILWIRLADEEETCVAESAVNMDRPWARSMIFPISPPKRRGDRRWLQKQAPQVAADNLFGVSGVGSWIKILASFLVKTILRASYLKYVLIIICLAILLYLLAANFSGARTVL